MKILNALLALIFLVFAALQYNDPDPVRWMAAYGAVCILCALAAFGRHFRYVDLGLAVVLAIWMLTMLPGVADWVGQGMPSIAGAMHAETPYIEVMREFLGLLIAVGALLHLWRLARRLPRQQG